MESDESEGWKRGDMTGCDANADAEVGHPEDQLWESC